MASPPAAMGLMHTYCRYWGFELRAGRGRGTHANGPTTRRKECDAYQALNLCPEQDADWERKAHANGPSTSGKGSQATQNGNIGDMTAWPGNFVRMICPSLTMLRCGSRPDH